MKGPCLEISGGSGLFLAALPQAILIHSRFASKWIDLLAWTGLDKKNDNSKQGQKDGKITRTATGAGKHQHNRNTQQIQIFLSGSTNEFSTRNYSAAHLSLYLWVASEFHWNKLDASMSPCTEPLLSPRHMLELLHPGWGQLAKEKFTDTFGGSKTHWRCILTGAL